MLAGEPRDEGLGDVGKEVGGMIGGDGGDDILWVSRTKKGRRFGYNQDMEDCRGGANDHWC